MRSIVATAAIGVGLLLTGCERAEPGAPAVEVEEAWVRLPPIPGRPAAAYFTLRGYNAAIRLTGVTSEDAERVELHDNRMEGSTARMAPLTEPVVVPQDGETAFEPGGRHAMLFGLSDEVRAGGRMNLTFSFEGIEPVTVAAEVRAAGDPSHSAH